MRSREGWMVLIWVVGAFLVGIVAGSGAGPVAAPAVAAGLLLIVAAVRWSTRMGIPLVVLAFLLVGVARAGYQPAAAGPGLEQLAGRTLQVEGTVSEEPDIRDSGANYVISAQSAVVGGKKVRVTGKVSLHTPRAET